MRAPATWPARTASARPSVPPFRPSAEPARTVISPRALTAFRHPGALTTVLSSRSAMPSGIQTLTFPRRILTEKPGALGRVTDQGHAGLEQVADNQVHTVIRPGWGRQARDEVEQQQRLRNAADRHYSRRYADRCSAWFHHLTGIEHLRRQARPVR